MPNSHASASRRRNVSRLKILLFLCLFFVCWAAGCEGCNRIEQAHGERVGVVTKFAQKGVVWKTYQGELAMQGMAQYPGGAMPNIWLFSLDNQRRHNENTDSLVAQISSYLSANNKVKVTYIAPLYTWPWRSNNKFLVQSVCAVQ